MVCNVEVLLTVPVRKPGRQEFFRVHPGDDWRLPTAVLETEEDRTTYLVDPSLWPELPGEIKPKLIVTAVTRQGVVFLWPLALPGEDGRVNAWWQSALEAAKIAETCWTRLAANMSLGAYEVFQASGELPEPSWPEEGFQRLVEIAFRDTYIDNSDHPALRRLRGEV